MTLHSAGQPEQLGRVSDALGDKVHVFALLGVEAEAIVIVLQDLADDDGSVLACVKRDLASRLRGPDVGSGSITDIASRPYAGLFHLSLPAPERVY